MGETLNHKDENDIQNIIFNMTKSMFYSILLKEYFKKLFD